MSLYETIWKNEKNRTLLISTIIAIGALILAMIIASLNYESAPNFIRVWYFSDQTVRHYSIGLVLIEIFLLSLFYFFLLIAIATLSEIRANLPSWGTILLSTIIAFLVTWFVTSIHPSGQAQPTNFTTGMQWTIFGTLICVVILSIVYLAFTEPKEELER
ncbi:hypothetical protein ES705_49482 [subsurface metagenome]